MSVIDGKYEVGETLGAGGMGSVFAARHLLTGRKVALKVMRAEYAKTPGSCDRFLREARAASMIEHPNIVQIHDVGKHDGAPYMVMDLLRGESLGSFLERKGQLPVEQVLQVTLPILDALSVAHGEGVVHRDVKPDNIFLAEVNGRRIPKLLDFGIARVAHEASLRLTGTGQVIGTPQYMAPEQAEGIVADHRADLYAMGVILYEALTGRPPISASSYSAMLVALLKAEITPLLEVAPNVKPEVAAVVHRAMARQPDDRYQTAQALIAALEDAVFGADALDVSATSPRSLPLMLRDTELGPDSRPNRLSRSSNPSLESRSDERRPANAITPIPRRRGLGALAFLVIVICALIGGFTGFASLRAPLVTKVLDARPDPIAEIDAAAPAIVTAPPVPTVTEPSTANIEVTTPTSVVPLATDQATAEATAEAPPAEALSAETPAARPVRRRGRATSSLRFFP